MDTSSLSLQNPWWNRKKAIEEDDKVRKILAFGAKLVMHLDDRNMVMVGPRQLGKTTALKYDIYKKIINDVVDPENILYYSFDTTRNFEQISEVIDTFMEATSGKRYLYLDEVSFVEDWQRAIKFFLDSPRSKDARLYITGSSSINLKKELFPGRDIEVREFLPITFHDFVVAFGSKRLIDFVVKNCTTNIEDIALRSNTSLTYLEELSRLFHMFVTTGGYPLAVVDFQSNGQVGKTTMETHWNAFLSDVSKAGKSAEIATSLMISIVKSYGSKANMSKMARDAGVPSHVTARDYSELFKDLFAIDYVFPLNKVGIPIFRKERKIYFKDPFLFWMFSTVLNVRLDTAESRVIEGIVCNHLMRTGKDVGYIPGKVETDFTIGNTAIEVKWQNNIRESDIPGTDFRNNILLSKNHLGENIIPVPVFAALLKTQMPLNKPRVIR
jgi:predicted AAA+ superfamily ATPase